MKIGSPITPFQTGKPAEHSQARKASAGGSSTAPDSVSLSQLSQSLSAVETRIGSGGVDPSRLESIKTAIRNGEFKVDAEAVADRLLKSVQEMLARKG